ncbi:glyoxylase-like metal-dependent hydrolase (beta-lactamase superfamily II) [Advenella incenata]|jgi:glyoxylase-like metal-dependent hydrolase (beta-lactamase superfamily II)|uniref:Glyoxylase-like metal-dependent hydrolase (Beta-lactamase superfamily II) n=1 Tax=Advenella incenata TaxID=267800 RepID=A0A4Q7VT57_9BURK|nr:MBL fold metallo-hydrolase [Advenella incenata]RZT99564.1 glyoxylase-like metal-dependent hydrolase (beta-lactamase superfamily II) [Advenella incenata]
MYKVDVLVQGYPGRSVCNGGLGWSTTTLLRSEQHKILVDVGAFGVRHFLEQQLKSRGVSPEEITDVVLTHAHYDHAVNFVLFPNATVWIGAKELSWASAQPPGFNPLPELYVRELTHSPNVRRVQDGDTFLPGITAIASPGHTPGHLLFYVDLPDQAILFTGDAAKNRAELLSGSVNDTCDVQASADTLKRIWDIWKRVPDTLLVPGHDLGMRLHESGEPFYMGERLAAINAWFGDTLEPTRINLCCGGHSARYNV